MIRTTVAVFCGALTLCSSSVSARCGLAFNESSVYGYGGGALRCTTLEEIEAELRSTSMPRAEVAFAVPTPFDRSRAIVEVDYRPYGALSPRSDILDGPPVTTTSNYRAFVKGWPPVSPLAACTIAGCGSTPAGEGSPTTHCSRSRVNAVRVAPAWGP